MSGGALRIAAAKAAGCTGQDADKKRKERARRPSRQPEGSQEEAAAAAAALPDASSAKVTPDPKHPKLTGLTDIEDEEVPSSVPRNLEMEFAAVAHGGHLVHLQLPL